MPLALLLASLSSIQRADPPAAFVETYCSACHAGEEPGGELLLSWATLEADAAVRERVRAVLAEGRMPPPEEALRPTAAEVTRFLGELAGSARDAPRLRRLNRFEYAYAVRDLFGVEFDAREHLPPDESGAGFDTNAGALAITPLLVERYFEAAEEISAAAVRVQPDGGPVARRFDGRDLRATRGGGRRGGWWVLTTNGALHVQVPFERAGEYDLRVVAFAQQAGPEPARMALRVGELPEQRFDVPAVRGAPGTYTARFVVTPGEQRVAAAFVNDYYAPDDPDPENRDRNLVVRSIEVVGPLAPPPPTWLQRRVRAELATRPPRAVFAGLARRAFRGPVGREELDALLDHALAADSIDAALQRFVAALLVSPRFLFRTEGGGPPRDLELAARLSFFLWSSTPDERLLDLASAGRLRSPGVLEAELARLLRDPRSSALAERFAAQWLQLDRLERALPDRALFPDFDEELRASMRAEAELFFDTILREGRPVAELLLADFTFVDARLAEHYGLPRPSGAGLRRVPAGERRGGLLTQAGVLAATSNPNRTSPVRRGKWVLEVLLDAPPPAPPPDVPALPEADEAAAEGTLRERLERHRADPACAVCHLPMDPYGLVLENYDALGAWRAREAGQPIDASTELPDGTRFDGPRDLAHWLVEEGVLVRTLVHKLAVYALGRELAPAERAELDALAARLDPRTATLRAILQGVVTSETFRGPVSEPGG